MHMTDDEMRQHMATLDDEQLSDFLAAVDAAEILERRRTFDHGASAVFYAERLRWPVFPLQPRSKHPIIARAHPDDRDLQRTCKGVCGREGHGLYDATRDLDTIREWWARWPEANIGVRTGIDGCGYDVIDVDGRKGILSLADWKHSDCPPHCSTADFCAATGPLPPIVARTFTPGDPREPGHEPGRHLFTPSTGAACGTEVLPGIDLRGDGGYVVVPPSVGPTGTRYSWITRPELPA